MYFGMAMVQNIREKERIMLNVKKIWKVSIISLIMMPITLLSIDTDLEQMNKYDDEKMKELSPLFTTRAGYAYSEWKMPNMNSFSQETQGLNLIWIDLIYKGNRDTVEGNRNYLHYEKSFNDDWSKNGKIISQHDAIGNGGSYELIKGKITFPFSFNALGEKSIFFKASREQYLSRISAKRTVGLVNQDGSIQKLNPNERLYFETNFNEIALGINQSEKFETYLFFGDYQKPYTVLKNGSEIENFKDYLFYSKIENYGIGMNYIEILNNFYLNPTLGVKGSGERNHLPIPLNNPTNSRL